MRSFIHSTIVVSLVFLNIACSSSGTGSDAEVDGATAAPASTGSAVAAVFGSSGNASVSAALIRNAVQQAESDDSMSTCESLSGDPSSVDSSAIDPDFESGAITSKTYGVTSNEVTLTEDDFCENADGESNEGDELYAYFLINTDVPADCSDGTSIIMKAGSEGAWILNDTNCPDIYGTFIMEDEDGIESTVNCYIQLNCEDSENEEANAHCTDEDGVTVTLDEDTTCEING